MKLVEREVEASNPLISERDRPELALPTAPGPPLSAATTALSTTVTTATTAGLATTPTPLTRGTIATAARAIATTTLTTALALTLTGCGARSQLVDTTDPPADSPLPSDPSDPTPSTPHFACHITNSPRPMLAARLGPSVRFIYPDRSSKEVITFDLPEGSYIAHADVVARGDQVAAYIVANALGGTNDPPPFAEVAIASTDGTVLYQKKHSFEYQGWGSDSQLVGGSTGQFLLSLVEVQAQLGLVLDDTGAATFTDRLAARGDIDAQGQVVMWDAESASSATLLFFNVDTHEITPPQFLLDPDSVVSAPAVLGGGIVYLRHNPSRVVYEQVSGTTELPLDFALEPNGWALAGYLASGDYRLFALSAQAGTETPYLVTNAASGEVRDVVLQAPAGYEVVSTFLNPPAVDGSGRLLAPLYTKDALQLAATYDGASWEMLGLPVTVGLSGAPAILEAGGTVVFNGPGGSEEVPGALAAYKDQLIGPQGGEGVELVRWEQGAPDNPFYAEDELSSDGRCLAYFRAGSLHIVEVADYTSSDLGLTTEDQSAQMAWIPLQE